MPGGSSSKTGSATRSFSRSKGAPAAAPCRTPQSCSAHQTQRLTTLRNDDNAPYTLPGFSLFFHDFDGGGLEWMSATGYKYYELSSSPASSINVDTSPVNPTFKSTASGNVPDASDPDPMAWGDAQKAIAVALHFENKSTWTVTLEIAGGVPPDGRGFGMSGLGSIGVSCPPPPPFPP